MRLIKLLICGSDIQISAIGIVIKVNELLLGVVIGIAIGGQPILEYNYGTTKVILLEYRNEIIG